MSDARTKAWDELHSSLHAVPKQCTEHCRADKQRFIAGWNANKQDVRG